MKKIGVFVVVLLVLTAGSIILNSGSSPTKPGGEQSSSLGGNSSTTGGAFEPSAAEGGAAGKSTKQGELTSEQDESSDGVTEQPDRPATEIYKTAADALKAIKDAASHYDDIVLEQFSQPPADCSWCPELYKSLRDLALSADTPTDQKSYFGEILAISGRPENIEALMDAVEKAGYPDAAQVYAEALEMASGNDSVVQLLGTHLSTTNETLRESLVAAISNQGTPLAIETLYKFTVESKDPDGFYARGTGLGETIPQPSAFPLLKDLAQKHDEYSHLAVKSLLNAGTDGVKAVFDLLRNSKDPEADRKILKDALDHVTFEEQTEQFVKDEAEHNQNPAATEFAKLVLDTFKEDAAQQQTSESGSEVATSDEEQ